MGVGVYSTALHEMKHRRAYGSPHDSLLGQSNSSVLTRLSCYQDRGDYPLLAVSLGWQSSRALVQKRQLSRLYGRAEGMRAYAMRQKQKTRTEAVGLVVGLVAHSPWPWP